MKKIPVESGKGLKGNVNYIRYICFLNWVSQRFIILLFIFLCIFKILYNLKVYTCGRFEEKFN